MKSLDQMLDELQEKVGGLFAAMHELDDEGKKKRTEFINSRLAIIREQLGPERMKEVERKLQELEPKIRVVQPRQLDSNAPVRDVDAHDLERYYLLKQLINS